MTNLHQQRIRETLHSTSRIQPQELAPVLAHFYTVYSFTVARQQLQQLADTLSSISVAISGFVMDIDWQQREAEVTNQQREATRKATGPKGEAMLSVKEVAEMLHIQKQKVYNMVKSGQLPYTNINQGTGKKPLIRIRASDVP